MNHCFQLTNQKTLEINESFSMKHDTITPALQAEVDGSISEGDTLNLL